MTLLTVVPRGDPTGPGEQLGLKCHPKRQGRITGARHATLGPLEKPVLQEPYLGSLPIFFLIFIYLAAPGLCRSPGGSEGKMPA